MRPQFLSGCTQADQPPVHGAVDLECQCYGPFLCRDPTTYARCSLLLCHRYPVLRTPVYPHRRIYIVFPLATPPLRKRSPVFELRSTQNQQLSGTGFSVPKSTVFGTIVLLRTYVDTYTIKFLKVALYTRVSTRDKQD